MSTNTPELDNIINGLVDHLGQLHLGNPDEPLFPQEEVRKIIATATATYFLASGRFGSYINAYAELNQSDLDRLYIAAAQEKSREGELEIDDCAATSKGSDDGAYVMAWLWVDNSEAGIESSCKIDDDDSSEDPS